MALQNIMYLDFSELDELEKCTECIDVQRITVWPRDSLNDNESKISEFVQDCGQWVEMGVLDKVSRFLESPNCYKVTVLGEIDEPVVFYLVSKYASTLPRSGRIVRKLMLEHSSRTSRERS